MYRRGRGQENELLNKELSNVQERSTVPHVPRPILHQVSTFFCFFLLTMRTMRLFFELVIRFEGAERFELCVRPESSPLYVCVEVGYGDCL